MGMVGMLVVLSLTVGETLPDVTGDTLPTRWGLVGPPPRPSTTLEDTIQFLGQLSLLSNVTFLLYLQISEGFDDIQQILLRHVDRLVCIV